MGDLFGAKRGVGFWVADAPQFLLVINLNEVLFSRDADMLSAFENDFAGMARNPVTLTELQRVRRKIKLELPAALMSNQRQFLLGLVAGEPNGTLMKCRHLSQLPAIKRKL
jgi:hypothetical protein